MAQPDYWWYRARAELLRAALGEHLGAPHRLLDVGSADGPSVRWLRADLRIALDLDPRGLVPGRGVCGSALALPFADRSFEVVGAFDVIEHCVPEERVVAELHRVLEPGGRLLASVPAYDWAWTDHDVRAGHHRRYTRGRLVRALEAGGLEVLRATYAFAGVFPVFAAQRLVRQRRERRGAAPLGPGLPPVPPAVDGLLVEVSRAEARLLRRHDLPFGSSVLVAARRPK